MDNQQDRPQPGVGDICPDLGGLEITGPIEITWPDGAEELQRIRQAANRCATYLQDIRHILAQIYSTSGQMADAMQRIHDGMDAMQGDIAYAADTLSHIDGCVCRGLSAQIEAADRPLQTWETTINGIYWCNTQVIPVASIISDILITRITAVYTGPDAEIAVQLVTAIEDGNPPTFLPQRVLYPPRAQVGDNNMMLCPRGMQQTRDNLACKADTRDYMLGVYWSPPPMITNVIMTIGISYYRIDGMGVPALVPYRLNSNCV